MIMDATRSLCQNNGIHGRSDMKLSGLTRAYSIALLSEEPSKLQIFLDSNNDCIGIYSAHCVSKIILNAASVANVEAKIGSSREIFGEE